MTSAHAPNGPPASAVPRPATLLVCLPFDLVEVINRKEFLDRLSAKSLIQDIACVQNMPNGVYRVTCKTQSCYNWLSINGLSIRGEQCTITEAQPSHTFVRLFNCPFEVSHDVVAAAFSKYGKVVHVRYEFDQEFPDLATGTRSIKLLLKSSIPSRIFVKRYPCNVWYRGQPKTCRICNAGDHEAPTCPLKGKCRRCHQDGHMARDCQNAWGTRSTPAAEQAVHPAADPGVPLTSAAPGTSNVPVVPGVAASTAVDPLADDPFSLEGTPAAPSKQDLGHDPVVAFENEAVGNNPVQSDPSTLVESLPPPSQVSTTPISPTPSPSLMDTSQSSDISDRPATPLELDADGFLLVSRKKRAKQKAEAAWPNTRPRSSSLSSSHSRNRSRSRSPLKKDSRASSKGKSGSSSKPK